MTFGETEDGRRKTEEVRGKFSHERGTTGDSSFKDGTTIYHIPAQNQPQIKLSMMTRWAQAAPRQTRQIIRRAARLAIKKGDPRAFARVATVK